MIACWSYFNDLEVLFPPNSPPLFAVAEWISFILTWIFISSKQSLSLSLSLSHTTLHDLQKLNWIWNEIKKYGNTTLIQSETCCCKSRGSLVCCKCSTSMQTFFRRHHHHGSTASRLQKNLKVRGDGKNRFLPSFQERRRCSLISPSTTVTTFTVSAHCAEQTRWRDVTTGWLNSVCRRLLYRGYYSFEYFILLE